MAILGFYVLAFFCSRSVSIVTQQCRKDMYDVGLVGGIGSFFIEDDPSITAKHLFGETLHSFLKEGHHVGEHRRHR